MSDQADQLRALVHASASDEHEENETPIVTVAGGCPRVGVSTIASQLAIELCRRGRPIVLVDANHTRPNLARCCHVDGSSSIDDVLSGSRTLQESLVRGPSGIEVLPGTRSPDAKVSPASQKRLVAALRRAGSRADIIIVDGGESNRTMGSRYCHASDIALLVTTGDTSAVTGLYAAMKLAAEVGTLSKISVLVHRVETRNSAADIEHRVATACNRFLNQSIECAPSLLGVDANNDSQPIGNRRQAARGSEEPAPYGTLARFVEAKLAIGSVLASHAA